MSSLRWKRRAYWLLAAVTDASEDDAAAAADDAGAGGRCCRSCGLRAVRCEVGQRVRFCAARAVDRRIAALDRLAREIGDADAAVAMSALQQTRSAVRLAFRAAGGEALRADAALQRLRVLAFVARSG